MLLKSNVDSTFLVQTFSAEDGELLPNKFEYQKLGYMRTIRDMLRYAVSGFNKAQLCFGHGNHNAFDEAAYLILHTLNLPLDQLEPFMDARLFDHEIEQLFAVIHKRIQERIPAAYITNEAWLGGYRFYVDQRAIVPRSFIAELIPERFAPWLQAPEQVRHVLDLCTGSGCLAILLAEAFPQAQIDAVDISAAALEVAQRNIDDYALSDRIDLIESDLYSQLSLQQYDVIVSNPPYVNADSINKLPQEYRHEPPLALAGGVDGMDFVRKIVDGATRHLTPEGILVVEIGNEYEHAQAAFSHLELTWLPTSAGDEAVFLLTSKQLIS